jgi:DNA polymerase-3 subunit epsilon
MIDYSKINVNSDDPDLYKLARKGANIIIKLNNEEVILKKVIRGYREDYMVTKTFLKSKGLMPATPPIAYEFQQHNGDIFYLYDKNKTKKFELTEEEKLELKQYRQELKKRKTCPKCGEIQRFIDDVSSRYLPNGKYYYSCPKCFETKEVEAWKEVNLELEKFMKERRSVKHDFTSYFINKGIEIDATINTKETYDIVYLDFETTGLSAEHDEIIQVSIIDKDGIVLLYKLCKPLVNQTWDEAMAINEITPADVEDAEPFEYYIEDISSILTRAKTIVCYNCPFEIGFLNKYGVIYSEDNSTHKFEDCMIMFAEIYGEWNDYFEDYKWQKLTTAANYYEYNFEGQEHNSLADVLATKFVYEKILSRNVNNKKNSY